MSHFDEITGMLYLDGQLDRERAAELRAHAAACDSCRALLAALERETGLLREALLEEEEPVSARLLERPLREPVPWAWIGGLGVAAAGAYTLWTGMVEPLRQQLSQAGFGEGNLLTMLFFSGAFWQGWSAMTNFIEWMAAVMLGIVVLALVGRRWRRRAALGIVIGGLLATLLAPGAARAAEVRKGNPDYSLRPGEVVKHDLLVTANSAQIDGEVDGDLFVFAHHVEIGGHITGDVIGFAGEIRITGRVDGNIRDCSQSLYLDGSVGKNITGGVGLMRLASKAQVGGSVMAGTQDLQLRGRVARDLMTFAKDETIDGFVGGDARLQGRRLSIGPNAEIQGQASFTGRMQPEISPQAKLASPLDIKIVKQRPDYTSPRPYVQLFLLWGVAFLFGVLIALVMPGFFAEVVRSTHRYGVSLGVGAITLAAGVVLAVIAVLLLCIGLAGGAIVLLLFAPALYSAEVFVGTWLGEKLLGPSAGAGKVLGRMALGLLVIRVVWLIPYLGWILWLGVELWGVGALALTLYKTARPQAATAA
jgi:anti-sigma factor RsiW/cytoskeletal protein CcmA (bactofilin family)